MTIDKTIRWGILGCGDVTEVKSGPPYQLTEGFELKAVMRRNEEKVQDYAKRHHVEKWYTDADQLINDPTIDAIYIATPPDSHLEYALKVADAGKPCCIEKPMAPSYQESKAILDAFSRNNVPLFIAYYRRSLPRFTKIKSWIEENKIGNIRHVDWQLHKFPNHFDLSGEYNWRTDVEVAPGGYFDDLASHGLDLFAFLLGDFQEVSGIATNQQGLYKAKDAIAASWIHKNGITGTGHWNFGSYKNEERVVITGSLGCIEFSVFDEKPLIFCTKNGKEELFIENPKHIQQYYVEHIRDHLQGVSQHPSTGKTAAHISWVMDTILGAL